MSYYSYGALATDRYPPFTLAEVPDYPATLDIAYPEHLSRGLVLVKWWLLAIPHYLIVAFFIGGGWLAWRGSQDDWWTVSGGGLVSLLVLVAAVILLFTSRYPVGIFDVVLGMNRWVLRVAGYAGLMTDAYPPFRLDLGGEDPSGALRHGRPGDAPSGPVPARPALGRRPGAAPTTGPAAPGGWTAGRIVAVVGGSLLALASLGLLGAGAVGLWADTTQRDDAGFVHTTDESYLDADRGAGGRAGRDLGRGPAVAAARPGDRAGPGHGHAVRRPGCPCSWASGRARTCWPTCRAPPTSGSTTSVAPMTRPTTSVIRAPPRPRRPTDQTFWSASSTGTGSATLTWTPQNGSWALVAMQADGSPGVAVTADLARRGPGLLWLSLLLLAIGLVDAHRRGAAHRGGGQPGLAGARGPTPTRAADTALVTAT